MDTIEQYYQQIKSLKTQLHEVKERKKTLTDPAEIKDCNREINRLYVSISTIKSQIAWEKCIDREFSCLT